MCNIIRYINSLLKNVNQNEIIQYNKNINENDIIEKYHLDRLFNNFIDDYSPKHYLDLSSLNNQKNNLLQSISIIINELINKLQNNKYKYFVKNNSVYGELSFNKLKSAIIYGLYIIDNYHKEINVRIFTKYIFDSLIEMFNSINSDYKILRNYYQYVNIINNIYYKLYLNVVPVNIINSQKIENIIYSLMLINSSDKIIDEKLKIIYSILIEIK